MVVRTGKAPTASEFASFIRNASILCDAERLELHDSPTDFQLDETDRLECDQVIEGLSVGRQVIFEGEPIVVGTQSDAPNRELFTITDVNHSIHQDLWNDTFHTTIRFDRSTSLPYKRDSVRIYANVVPATHGETHNEVLGSGDAGRAFQAFGLQRAAVTQLPAPTPRGTEDQLKVYVNDVRWHESRSFIDAKPDDRTFVAMVGSEQQVEVVFGDGETGSRLPTGVENIQATYRTGVGHDGNVAARQIDQVVVVPLGVKKVINPLPAQGAPTRILSI